MAKLWPDAGATEKIGNLRSRDGYHDQVVAAMETLRLSGDAVKLCWAGLSAYPYRTAICCTVLTIELKVRLPCRVGAGFY